MDKELIQFVEKNKDIQVILKIIMKETGTLEIKYNKGKINRKQLKIDL